MNDPVGTEVITFSAYILEKIFQIKNKVQPLITVDIREACNNFPDFFRMGTFIDSTLMKL